MDSKLIILFVVLLLLFTATLIVAHRSSRGNRKIVIPSPPISGTMTMQTVSTAPHITLIHNFLSNSECDYLISLAEPRMNRSTVQSEKLVKSKDRTSFTTNLERHENETIIAIERRAAQIANNAPVENMEPLQIVRYQPGQFYKPHYDYFVHGAKGTEQALKRGGQRTVTFFVYLNDLPAEESGGGTVFPKLNIEIRPRKGMAVYFHNMKQDGTEDDKTLHGGQPPQRSSKYGANIWIRQHSFH